MTGPDVSERYTRRDQILVVEKNLSWKEFFPRCIQLKGLKADLEHTYMH